jgi:hypothetical protein
LPDRAPGAAFVAPINSAQDVVSALAAVTNFVADGTLTVEDASELLKIFEAYASVMKMAELQARLEAHEASITKERM